MHGYLCLSPAHESELRLSGHLSSSSSSLVLRWPWWQEVKIQLPTNFEFQPGYASSKGLCLDTFFIFFGQSKREREKRERERSLWSISFIGMISLSGSTHFSVVWPPNPSGQFQGKAICLHSETTFLSADQTVFMTCKLKRYSNPGPGLPLLYERDESCCLPCLSCCRRGMTSARMVFYLLPPDVCWLLFHHHVPDNTTARLQHSVLSAKADWESDAYHYFFVFLTVYNCSVPMGFLPW